MSENISSFPAGHGIMALILVLSTIATLFMIIGVFQLLYVQKYKNKNVDTDLIGHVKPLAVSGLFLVGSVVYLFLAGVII